MNLLEGNIPGSVWDPERLKNLRIELDNQNQYFVLNLDSSSIAKGFQCTISNVNTVLLLSDGFSRVVDTYHLFKDYYDLLINLEEQGIEQIYGILRETEQRDLNVQQYPRLRVSDDASLIWATID